jgi:hypothetical protein
MRADPQRDGDFVSAIAIDRETGYSLLQERCAGSEGP